MDEAPCRVILIDDNSVDRFILKRSLEIVGLSCEIKEFERPREAIEFLSNQANKVSMVVTDMLMPDIDGYKVIQAIRELAHRPLVPIVAITSYSPQYEEATSILTGANWFFTKPLSGNAIRKIASVLASQD